MAIRTGGDVTSKNLPAVEDVSGHAFSYQQTQIGHRLEHRDCALESYHRHVDIVHFDDLIANFQSATSSQFAFFDVLYKNARTADRSVDHRTAQRRAWLVALNVQVLLVIVCTVDCTRRRRRARGIGFRLRGVSVVVGRGGSVIVGQRWIVGRGDRRRGSGQR